MFAPEYTAGCPSCSAIADGFDGSVVHLANHDVTLCAVSRAPLAKLQAYKQRMGWSFPWASSFDSDFNYDFQVSHTRGSGSRDPSKNFRKTDFRLPAGEENPWSPGSRRARERIGRRTGGRARHERVRARGWRRYHTYSAYARGSTSSGACTSGSTARHWVATRPASGTAATTSTTAFETRDRKKRTIDLE